MRKLAYRFLIWTLVLVFMAVLAGCQEEEKTQTQEQTISPQRAKLVAAENIQLKKDISARDTEIEKQKTLLAKCEEEKERLNKSLKQKSEGLMEAVIGSMDKDAQSIRAENEALKKQIEELKKQLEEKQ